MNNLRLLAISALLIISISGCATPIDEAATEREKELENSNAIVNSNTPTADTIDSLTKAVADTIAKADSATPSGTDQENQTRFFDLKHELDALDNKLDSHDDYLEAQYKQNLLSHEEYRSQKKQLEKLENDLDNAEDRLEKTFRIDD